MNNKRIKFLLITIISIGILLIVGTYAYFNSEVNTNGNGLTTTLTTTVGDITLTKSVSEISSNKLIPGESISMNFNVNNPNKVDTYFSLYWDDVTNTFVNKNDLKVSIIRITNNEEESILSNAVFPSDEGPLLKGMLARAYTNEEYRLVVTYENTTSDQTADMNKSIKGTIKPMLVDKLNVRIIVEGTSRNIETGSDAKVSDLGTPVSSDPNKVFMGWSTSENGDKVDENSSIDPNETYYAVYGTKINVETSNEEEVSEIDTLNTRNTVDDLDKPTKVGYNFKGWSKTANGTVLANNTYLEENTTYYAVYEPITYEVKYNQGIATSGTLPNTQNATYDVSINLGNNTMTKDNLVVDSYKVTYSNGDSSSGTLPSEQISKNTTTYTADGWSTTSDGTKVYESNESVSNLTTENNGTFNLYPYFASSTTNGGVTLGTNSMSKSNTDTGTDITINLNANGGSSTGDSDNKLYSNKYTTYTANGWTKTSGSRTRDYANGASTGALSGNLTLYPCFSEGAAYDAVNLPTPTRAGYIYKGWSTDSSATSGSTTTYTPTSDTAVTLYAIWQPITYQIKYNQGTASSTTNLPGVQNATYDVSINLSNNTMTKSNTQADSYKVTYNKGDSSSGTLPSEQISKNTISYTADGWSTTSDGTKVYESSESVSNLTTENNGTFNLYPYFTSSTTNGGVTLGTNSMSKSNTDSGTDITINLNANGGSSTGDDDNKLYSNKYITYTANGWTKTSGSRTRDYANGASTGALSGNLTLYPCFSEGAAYDAVNLPTPTRAGYIYKGWSTDSSATSGSTTTYTPTSDTAVTLYAIWQPITYQIKYNQGVATSGTLPSTQNATYDASINLGNNTMTKSNTQADSYKVTYNKGTSTGGTLPSNQTSKNTTTYTADGWSTTSDGTKVYESNQSVSHLTTENNGTFNLYPYFASSTTNGGVTLGTNNMSKSNDTTNVKVTINLNANGGSSTGDSDNKLYSNKYTKYTKNGWTKTSGSTTRNYKNGASTGALTANLTLYPCFSQSAVYDAVNLPTPTRAGYIYKGWSTDSSATSGSTTTYTPTSDTAVTLYAIWQPITYQIKYNQGVATSGTLPSTQNATYDASINLGNNTMTKSNTQADSYKVTYNKGTSTGGTLPSNQTSKNTTAYKADGWSTTSGGSKVYSSGASVSNLTNEKNGTFNLYPYFKSTTTNGGVTLGTNNMSKSNDTTNVKVTINLNANGGSSTGDSDNKLYSNKYTKYTKNGWTKTSGSTTRHYANGVSTGALTANLTLYPCFSQSAAYDAVSLPTPSRTGYIFKGWSTNSSAASGVTGTYTPTSDTAVTLYATWGPITYQVKYNQGTASNTTNLPNSQNATYDVSFNLGNNTMTKDKLVVDSYKVTYNKGDSSSGTLPSEQISKNTTTYTSDGWSTTSDGTKAYESNESISNLTTENNGTFNLYPYFSSSTTNGGVTLGTNSMSKSNTDSGTDITINLNANGGSSTGDSDNKLYSNKYTTYTANGWTKTSGSRTRDYANGASTGALSGNLTLYPCFSEGAVYDAVNLPTPTRAGYIYKGWSTDSSATSGITGTYTPTSDTEVTLYATWEAIIYDDGTGASVPELAKGMVPIYYDGTTMKVADTSQEWYNYADHEWANAVLVDTSNSTIKNKYFNDDMTLKTTAVGQTVDMSEVQQMYVWIPRYRYQLWNVNNGSSDPQAINIIFEDKNTTKSSGNGDWLTHPAFTFGTEELNGIWVGKFENSGDTSNITIKPNMASLASLNVSTMFNATRAVESSSLLGLDANQIDSHMMKDTEWGAVAYLYSSIYGTYNADKSCIARGCEVWINNVSSNGAWNGTKYTGCAAQGVSTSIISGTTCESGRGWDGAGVNASTTGNMYGIYDMSGGNWEYTMSVMQQGNGTPQIQSSGFSTMPDSKYYNTYPYGTSYTDHARGTIGTATKETLKTFGSNPGGWNGDYSSLVNSSRAWALRGGLAYPATAAGVFAFSNGTGGAGANIGFRLVLALTA